MTRVALDGVGERREHLLRRAADDVAAEPDLEERPRLGCEAEGEPAEVVADHEAERRFKGRLRAGSGV